MNNSGVFYATIFVIHADKCSADFYLTLYPNYFTNSYFTKNYFIHTHKE